jgi:hypothetical protein
MPPWGRAALTTIRVDPSQLRRAALEISRDAERMRLVGDEVMRATQAAPSYDGEFGPRVSSIGVEGSARLKAEADRLSELSRVLLRKAEAFEAVDAQASAAMGEVGRVLRSWQESGLRFLSEGGLSWGEVRRALGQEDEDDKGPPPALGWPLGFLGLILKPFAQPAPGSSSPPLTTASETPAPPEQMRTATPTPTISILPTPSPTPQGTPAAEEIWGQKREMAERRREELKAEYQRRRELEDAWYSEDPMGYVMAKNEQVYLTARLDVNYLVSNKMSNPLPTSAFPYSTEVMILNNASRVNVLFLRNVHLDPSNFSNFEPLFLEKLKQAYTNEYNAAMVEAASDPFMPGDFIDVDFWE